LLQKKKTLGATRDVRVAAPAQLCKLQTWPFLWCPPCYAIARDVARSYSFSFLSPFRMHMAGPDAIIICRYTPVKGLKSAKERSDFGGGVVPWVCARQNVQ